MKRVKRRKVEGLWLVYDPDTYTAQKPGVAMSGVTKDKIAYLEEQGYTVTKDKPRVEFRYFGQKPVPNVLSSELFSNDNVVYHRTDGFWYFPAHDRSEQSLQKVYWRVTDPRWQARLDVEYEQFCGHEVPEEVLNDPWLYPPLYHKGE